jgi:hypothetical protein
LLLYWEVVMANPAPFNIMKLGYCSMCSNDRLRG